MTLSQFEVTGNYASFAPDAVVRGKVTFTPNLPKGGIAQADGPVGMIPEETLARISNGVLVGKAGAPVLLYSNDAELNLDGDLQYRVDFDLTVDNQRVPVDGFTFTAPDDDTGVDLVAVAQTSSVTITPQATITASQISDSTAVGRAVLKAVDQAAAQTALGISASDDEYHEYANLAAFPVTGATDLLYLAQDTGKLYRWNGSAYVQIADKSAVGLGNVDNTSDANKPVSTATQTALDLKAPLASPTFTGTVAGVTKSMVGLGSVDNTADTAKPVSTAQQTALDGKQPLDADLTAIAALTSAANKAPYSTASNAWALMDFTSAGRALVDDADIAAQRTTLSVKASVSIAHYGATTGSADNHTAIAAAISAVSAAGGGEVFIPTGTWITAPLAIPSYVTLVGEGAYSSVLKLKTGSNAHFLTLSTVSTMWVGLRDLCLNGNRTNQTSGDVIHFDNTGFSAGSDVAQFDANHFLHRIAIVEGYANGFYHTGPVGALQVVNVLSYGHGGEPFRIASPDNHFDHCVASNGGGHGFHIDGANQNRLVGCKSWFNGIPAGGGAGFYLDAGGSRNDLINCEAQDNTDHGFVLINAKDSIVIGKSERNGLGASPYAGSAATGIFASGVTNCQISLNCTDRNVSGTLMQSRGYNCGSGNDGNIVNLTIAPMSFGVAGVGSWGANSVVNIIYAGSVAQATEQICSLTSAYTLTSQTAAQPMFNATTNGAVTLSAGLYEFECLFTLSSMSATSGSFGWTLAAGTATIGSIIWHCMAIKSTPSTAGNAQGTTNTGANTALTTAGGATNGWAKIQGVVRITAAGTVVPQISLGIAAAAVVATNSYFRIKPAGLAAAATVGNWS